MKINECACKIAAVDCEYHRPPTPAPLQQPATRNINIGDSVKFAGKYYTVVGISSVPNDLYTICIDDPRFGRRWISERFIDWR